MNPGLIYKIVLTAFLCFGVISSVLLIGKPREALTPGATVASLIVTAMILFGLWTWL